MYIHRGQLRVNPVIQLVNRTLQPEVTIQPEVEELPPWVSAAKSAMADNVHSRGKLSTHISSQEENQRFTILAEEWVEDGIRPKHWIRRVQNEFNGTEFVFEQETFTCSRCPEQVKAGNYTCHCCGNYQLKISTSRCQSCNIKYKRWQRVRRAFKWLAQECEDRKVRPKFLTITEPLRTQAMPFTEEEIEQDRMKMLKQFRMTRKSSAWPRNYAGIWVYEAKVRAPGDEIRARWPDEHGNHPVIRTAEQFELHGHIHCALATKWLERDPLLERHSGVHVKASEVNHMKKYLMGYMLVDTVGRYNRIGSTHYG